LGIPSVSTDHLGEVSSVFLAVPDEQLASVGRQWSALLNRKTALIHCAGALPLEGLWQAVGPANPVGSFHPLCAISDPHDALTGCAVAIQATTPALHALLRRAARALKLFPFDVRESRRAAYHAGAVLAAAGVVSVLSAAIEAWRSAGLTPLQIQHALLPLTESALRGVRQRGVSGALTGPVVRGDAERLAAHLRALPKSIAPLYRALSQQAMKSVSLSTSARKRLHTVLNAK
jgi:predicted short-subunit dehydrogenase-like oxidoreductase (DUF2520 family)